MSERPARLGMCRFEPWDGEPGGPPRSLLTRGICYGEAMLDVVEQMELAAEKWADENVRGDQFRCDCGQWCPLDSGELVGESPYARPICPRCAQEAVRA